MIIRPVEARDAGTWSAMRARLWPSQGEDGLATEARAFVAGGSIAGLDAVLLAEDDAGDAVGFVELSVRAFADGCDSMPVPHVEGWYVEPSARRRGVGRALLGAAEDWARGQGFTELASDTEVENGGSRRAHGRCGFEEVERLVKFRKALV